MHAKPANPAIGTQGLPLRRWRPLARIGALLILALGLASALPALAAVEDFDGLACSDSGTAVPNGTGGLDWNNFLCLNAPGFAFNPSGYLAGNTSPPNVAANSGGDPATLTRTGGGNFSLQSGQFTGAWNNGLQLEVEGFLGSTSVATNTFTLSALGPTLIDLSAFANVDKVVFTSSGGTHEPTYGLSGTHFALDDLQFSLSGSVTAVPTLGQWSLLVLGLLAAGLGARRLRRQEG